MIIMLPNKPPLNSVAYNSKNLSSCLLVCRFSVFSLSRLGLAEWLGCAMDSDLLHTCSAAQAKITVVTRTCFSYRGTTEHKTDYTKYP